MKWRDTECWLWARNVIGGKCDYGKLFFDGKYHLAHRVMYESEVGQIPKGYDIDHLCRVPRCINPNHLEAVTRSENVKRGLRGVLRIPKTHCPKGHEYTLANSRLRKNGTKTCRVCERDYMRNLRKEKKWQLNGAY